MQSLAVSYNSRTIGIVQIYDLREPQKKLEVYLSMSNLTNRCEWNIMSLVAIGNLQLLYKLYLVCQVLICESHFSV